MHTELIPSKLHLPSPDTYGHKYDRGHALIYAAPDMTGATRLAATACNRIGAGLVTVLASQRADIYRAALPPDIIVREHDKPDQPNGTDEVIGIAGIQPHPRRLTALLGGCGGISRAHKQNLYENKLNLPRIIDADALPEAGNWAWIDAQTILTPHAGEFQNSFPDLTGTPSEKTIKAARLCGGVVLLKGPETLIASPAGQLARHLRPDPNLAKGGTGDVLSGFITGLVAQGLPVFEAACTAVYIHSEAARRLGAGLVASDMETIVPQILQDMLAMR